MVLMLERLERGEVIGCFSCAKRERSMDLPDAKAAIETILESARGRRLVVFLDYDGTLTPIVRRPELAVLRAEMRAELENLARYCPLAIVSGRDLEDVRGRVGVQGIAYAGSHGFDIEDRDGTRFEAAERGEVLALLRRAASYIRAQVLNVDGVHLELKPYSLAVHYRGVAPDEITQIQHAVERALVMIPGLQMSGGKKVFDLKPAIDWHKGRAVAWLLDRLQENDVVGCEEVFVVYIGDDTTDEDAFRMLGDQGVGILVAGDGAGNDDRTPSAADYRLQDPAAVFVFLQMLVQKLAETQKSAEDPRFFGIS